MVFRIGCGQVDRVVALRSNLLFRGFLFAYGGFAERRRARVCPDRRVRDELQKYAADLDGVSRRKELRGGNLDVVDVRAVGRPLVRDDELTVGMGEQGVFA